MAKLLNAVQEVVQGAFEAGTPRFVETTGHSEGDTQELENGPCF